MKQYNDDEDEPVEGLHGVIEAGCEGIVHQLLTSNIQLAKFDQLQLADLLVRTNLEAVQVYLSGYSAGLRHGRRTD